MDKRQVCVYLYITSSSMKPQAEFFMYYDDIPSRIFFCDIAYLCISGLIVVKCLSLCVLPAQSAYNVVRRKRSDTTADDADNEFPRVMFLMHQWFMSSKDLAELFMDLYPFSSTCSVESVRLMSVLLHIFVCK